ncbi:MAG TPA: carboxypeptidase-like regulatory domain-containing protein [Candidatus Paceibacterota bacterium]|nr:carboxypeptidase-like regulatory domain-containing protein [Candidatus Paceibacterota bacterium]
MNAPRGMSLVDVLVGSALILIVFVALLGLLRASLLVSSSAKAKAGATTVATTQLEYLRSLAYDDVGTVGGIPAGSVPQFATTTLNDIPYSVRTFVQYVDDPKDGLAGADSNGITTDYKRTRVTVTYVFRGEEREVALISNIAPPGIETNAGGGTIRVEVVDAVGSPVSGASVRIYNPSLAPQVDFTTFSDIDGVVLLGGAPTSTDYRITVSKDGYSTAETYARDATNANPAPGYLTVAANQTSTLTFAIDQLGTLVLTTLQPIRSASVSDSLDDLARISESGAVQASGGALVLSGSPGFYSTLGFARSTSTAPTYLADWSAASVTTTVPPGTGVTVQVTNEVGTLLPDSALPGNSTGFTTFPIDLSGVSTTTYPGLSLRAELSSPTGAETPQVLEWSLSFDEGPLPLPNVPFTLTSDKIKGTQANGTPIPKHEITGSTDAQGTRSLSLEWGIYIPTFTGYSVVGVTTTPEFTLSPASTTVQSLILE